MTMDEKPRKLLIVERKLISNRGHHHTQINALKSLFPNHQAYILAGDGYDGFLGTAVGTIGTRDLKLARLHAKLKCGTLTQRLSAGFSALLTGRLRLPASAYGRKLAEVCMELNITGEDIVIIPTADLDSLESAKHLSEELGALAPTVALRFLSPMLGEKDDKFRELRFRQATQKLSPRLLLFTETEEMARHFGSRFGMNVQGGFYMPCSIGFEKSDANISASKSHFRVGVFGAPRAEKGSHRIANIVRCVAEHEKMNASQSIEFVLQGSPEDLSETGVYRGLSEFLSTKDGVVVSNSGDRLSPVEFEKLFRSVDIILLPYDVSVYALQGSGVIQDAVAALKPIVHSKGMSMSSFLNHGNALAAVSDEDFAKAIMEVSRNSAPFVGGAMTASKYFENYMENFPAMFNR